MSNVPYTPTAILPTPPAVSPQARLANALRAFASDVERGFISETDQAVMTLAIRVCGAPCDSDDEADAQVAEDDRRDREYDASDAIDADTWPHGDPDAWGVGA